MGWYNLCCVGRSFSWWGHLIHVRIRAQIPHSNRPVFPGASWSRSALNLHSGDALLRYIALRLLCCPLHALFELSWKWRFLQSFNRKRYQRRWFAIIRCLWWLLKQPVRVDCSDARNRFIWWVHKFSRRFNRFQNRNRNKLRRRKSRRCLIETGKRSSRWHLASKVHYCRSFLLFGLHQYSDQGCLLHRHSLVFYFWISKDLRICDFKHRTLPIKLGWKHTTTRFYSVHVYLVWLWSRKPHGLAKLELGTRL